MASLHDCACDKTFLWCPQSLSHRGATEYLTQSEGQPSDGDSSMSASCVTSRLLTVWVNALLTSVYHLDG